MLPWFREFKNKSNFSKMQKTSFSFCFKVTSTHLAAVFSVITQCSSMSVVWRTKSGCEPNTSQDTDQHQSLNNINTYLGKMVGIFKKMIPTLKRKCVGLQLTVLSTNSVRHIWRSENLYVDIGAIYDFWPQLRDHFFSLSGYGRY